MDINARIDFQPGMELTAQALRELAANLDYKQSVTSSIAHHHRAGILPQAPFICEGAFVKNVIEIRPFRCMALLPSGRIVDANEDVTMKIPLLYGEKYYLTVSIGEGETAFSKGEVPYVRPQYAYELHTLDEVEQGDCLPVMKFVVDNGMFNIDKTFIPPHFLLQGDERLTATIDTLADKLAALASHPHLEEGEAQRCLQRYLFQLRSYDRKELTRHYMQFLQEIACAVDYHLMRPHTESAPEVPLCSPFDVAEWLTWFDGYLTAAKTMLDGVVPEDHTVDYEKLKQEIQADVYKRVYDEIYGQVKRDILEKFNPDMEQQIRTALTAYINDELQKSLHERLTAELGSSLHDKLYQPLYDALYGALYVPVEEKEEEEFIPQI